MFFRIVVLAAMMFSTAAMARELKINATAINFAAPSGFCELDEDNKADSRMLTTARGLDSVNLVLTIFADCNQLATWRSTSNTLLKDMIFFKTLKSYARPADQSTESVIKQACAETRAGGDKMIKDGEPDLRARAETFLKKVDIVGTQFLGVMDEAPGVCYASLLQKMKAENGENIAVVVMYTISFVRNELVFLYRNSRYVDSSSLPTALANLKVSYADFVAANR